jgi:hypothetical protein
MKKLLQAIYSIAAIILLGTALACNTSGHSTAPASPNAVAWAIDSGKWVFTANQVIPQYGPSRHADGTYSVTFTGSKLLVYLPYYGKAYAGANTFSNNGPLDFTSANFIVDKQQTKAGRWSITIKPKDYSEVQSMNFSLYSNGNASLNVTMNNRSAISYSGTVEPFK